MSIFQFLSGPDWDLPFFKKLARNDTGGAPGHQAGMVVPKPLRPFLPGLVGNISAHTPTVEVYIKADLFISTSFLGSVTTRYQFQTWGGTRSPEARLTDNLSAIRNVAREGDYLVIQRNIRDLKYYRLVLVRQDTEEYREIATMVGSKRWGALGVGAPVTDSEYREALEQEEHREHDDFDMFDDQARRRETRSQRVARSVAFRNRIRTIYEDTCSICGEVLQVPEGMTEFEAGHIVPRSLLGTDDARNGLGFCRRHHWAFDNGLFGVDDGRMIVVPARVRMVPRNRILVAYAGEPLSEPNVPELRASAEALRWHRENVML